MKQKLTIVKIGGNIIDDEKVLLQFLEQFSLIEGAKILVHGGGKTATQISEKFGIESKLIDGRRVTGAEEIKVVTMVYAGWLNKKITALVNTLGMKAIGLSGVDSNLIPAVKRPIKEIDYGFVGDVLTEEINISFLNLLLEQSYTPIIAPISADSKGILLNINADTIASSLAIAASKHFDTKLVLCFEKKGVLSNTDDEKSIIPELSKTLYENYKKEGIISKGMLPKIENALSASKRGVQVVIGHALDVNKNNFGTVVTI